MSALETYIGTKIIQAVLAQHVDGRPGYQVVYEDGYTSWSPKYVFEGSYHPVNAMSFSGALVMLRAGKKVSRPSWSNYPIRLQIGLGGRQRFVYQRPGPGSTAFEWGPTTEDLLAEDWQVVE